MPDIETDRPGLPVPINAAPARPSLAASAPTATFISQLIAARDRLPSQRERRRTSAEGAVGAYRQGAAIAVRRMPEGFRKTVLA